MSIAMTVGLVGALAGAVVALVVLPRRQPVAGTADVDESEQGVSA
jgi:hypothetical protein